MNWTVLFAGSIISVVNICRRCAIPASLLAICLLTSPAFAQTPEINSVQFTGSAGSYTLTLQGSGFGSPTVSLPHQGDVSNFRVGDSATFNESGYTGDADTLLFKSWTNTEIVVEGFGGQPGDAVTIALWNSTSQNGATWGGNVPTTGLPQITSVELSGTGQNVQIVVNGTEFGSAPASLPAPGTPGDTNYLRFIDFKSHCGSSSSAFAAGFAGWGVLTPNSVTLDYASWSNTQIVISGFGGAYGTGCATYVDGDPIVIVVYNSADTSQTGRQTAWGGPGAASISIAVQDTTTGKNIVSGSTITAGDTFQVTVTSAPTFNCAGQFVVTALGAAGAPPSVLVQDQLFIIGPASGANSVTGGVLTSNGTTDHENDWKVSASCNGASDGAFATSTFEFLSAVPN